MTAPVSPDDATEGAEQARANLARSEEKKAAAAAAATPATADTNKR